MEEMVRTAAALAVDVQVKIADRLREPPVVLLESSERPLVAQMERVAGMDRVVQGDETFEGLPVEHEPARVPSVDVPCLGLLVITEEADAAEFVIFHGHTKA